MTSIDSLVSPMTVVDSTLLFEKALHSWSAIDLYSLQKELDSKAIEIQDYQRESLIDRKELATQTKDFKKLNNDEKIENFNRLLKSYQNVIDSMNKKSKSVENLFFKVYRSIAEAPDPKPLLKYGLDTISSINELNLLKDENKLLEEKLLKFADYDKLKEQLEKTENQMKIINDTKIKAKENEWKSILEEKESNWLKNEKDKDDQIENLRKQIFEHEINEKMLKLKIKKKSEALGESVDEGEEEKGDDVNEIVIDGKKSNVDSLMITNLKNDLESSKKRIKSLEKRNEELRRDISSSNSNIEIEVQKAKQENNKLISNLESENSLIIAKLEHERKVSKKYEEEIKNLKNNFEKEENQLTNEIKLLKEIKNNTEDYDEIKKELELLKQIQFGGENDEFNSDSNEIEGDSISKIESAIIQRNKKLNNELIELRRKNEELDKQIKNYINHVKECQDEIIKLKDNNVRLENDLINFESTANNSNDDKWETMSMISSIAGGNNNINNNFKGKISPAASIAGGNDNKSVIAKTYGQDNTNNNNNSTLLPIITQQRDRFRNRNKELEEENKKHFSKIVELKREINTLKNDNRELYEKIRFLQYHRTAQNIQQNGGDIESKYRSDYEHDLHPIEQFRIMETKRINSNITPWDRIFVQATRTILSTPFTRWVFVAYCLSLHLLVMILTFSMLGSSNSIHEIEVSSPLTGHKSDILNS
jgi:homeobox protein cut-like